MKGLFMKVWAEVKTNTDGETPRAEKLDKEVGSSQWSLVKTRAVDH